MNGELDIRTAGFNANFSDNVDGGIPHGLVFPVREGLGRRHRDAVASVDTHGIEVLNGADDDHVVLEIPHDFQFIFLPSDEGLLHDDFGNHARLKPCVCKAFHLFPVVGHAPADSTQGKAGPDNDGIPDRLRHFSCLIHIPGDAALGHTQTYSIHGIPEQLPILSLLDDRHSSPDHFHIQSIQQTTLGHFDCRVKTGLPPQGGKDGMGSFPFDDFCDDLRGDGFNVGAVGRFRIGHNGGRITVDEHHLEPLLLQGLACLGS